MVLDRATSLIAKGKISLAIKEGKGIPEGWRSTRVGIRRQTRWQRISECCCLSGADIDDDISRTCEESEKHEHRIFPRCQRH